MTIQTSIDEVGELAAALDLMLTDAALGTTRRFLPGRSGLRFARALAGRPREVASRAGGLLAEYGRIAVGSSTVAPSARDRRFTDPAWTQNPALRRIVQAYLATGSTVEGLVQDGSLEWRTPVFELIQYRPRTGTVYPTPLLMIPPTINKFYIMDLAPGRSMIEYFVSQGLQVFIASWRNPDARHSKWGMDAYAQAVIDALEAVRSVSAADSVHLLGACSGGIIGSVAAAHLAAKGRQDRPASVTLRVTLINQARAGTVGALVDERTAAAAVAASRARGYLDGKGLAEVFAWLRPGDLIWNYWVNNYLQGRTPPAFDILYWNADTTRMTAGLHRDFVTTAMGNHLTRPGGTTALGTAIDIGQVHVDSYVVAGSADHICPWRNCYASTQLLGGKSRFVLSTNGHIAALVNPPTNKKSSYQVGEDNPADADDWQSAATTVAGSWWPDYTRWLSERSGAQVPAPDSLGGGQYRVLGDAPGSYVLDS